jgi:predicted RNA-binding Zn-ribbon protein involved in translation (DUF1610 family)
MPKVNEVEVNLDKNYVYYYCNSCSEALPGFVIDTTRIVESDDTTVCDGCGKEINDDATT